MTDCSRLFRVLGKYWRWVFLKKNYPNLTNLTNEYFDDTGGE